MKRIINKIIIIALSICMIGGLIGCNSETKEESSTIIYEDTLGRQVEIPRKIETVAVTGPLAQMMVFAVAPDMMVGLSSEWDGISEQYLDEKYYNLPVLGQFYGTKGELNLETLIAAKPDIVIDMGEPKGEITKDLNDLQDKTGIPFIHITCHLDDYDKAFDKLGELLDKKEEAKKLSDYGRNTYNNITNIMKSVGDNKKKVLLCVGEDGTNVIAKGSYQAELLNLMTDNVADVENPTSKGTGNAVSLEQILLWNPDIILFDQQSNFDNVSDDPKWNELSAIKNDTFYEAPYGPYSWIGSPPSVQRYLGMLWMGELLYKDYVNYDIKQEVKEYYKLFYHHDLTDEQYDDLVKNSLGKVQ